MTTAKTPSITPRKVAKQRRSQAKHDLILETTLTMLSEGPADKITTNEIAKKAGISVGTLYQFFPKKEAIFYELFKSWLQQTLDVLDGVDADYDGSEELTDCVDTMFDRLSKDTDINSPGHWQLRRAMGSSRELAELEARHFNEIVSRLIALQEKFGKTIPEGEAHALAYLQNQVSVACLSTMAVVGKEGQRERVLSWCRKTLYLVYDVDALNE